MPDNVSLAVTPMTEEQLSLLLDTYEQKVPHDDRVLFAEAVRAAQASALRAAYFTFYRHILVGQVNLTIGGCLPFPQPSGWVIIPKVTYPTF